MLVLDEIRQMELVHYHLPNVDSTNSWAKRNLHLFNPNNLTLISAESQTAGRGRHKRTWLSPVHNLFATFCFSIPLTQPAWLQPIPFILALSAADVLVELGFHPKLKWPNDLLISSKKVAGILCETVTEDPLRWMIAGIGINLNMSSQSLKEISQPATSLFMEDGKTRDVNAVLSLLSQFFTKSLERLIVQGSQEFLETYQKEILWMLGKRIHFHDGLHTHEGVVDSIQKDGSINLKLNTGEIKNFLSGEISDY